VFSVVLVTAFYGSLLLEGRGPLARLLIVELGILLAPTLAAAALLGLPPAATFSLRLPDWRGWAAGVLSGASAWALVVAISMWILPPPESFARALKEALLMDGGASLSVLLLCVAASPALCEELLFRGLILSGFRSWGMGRAVLASSLLFAVAHASVYRLLPAGLLGLLFGTLAWRTGSIFPSIVAHAVNNGIACWLATSPGLVTALGLEDPRATFLPLALAGAAGVILALSLLLRADGDGRGTPS
jgi:sodium transport system permease protein